MCENKIIYGTLIGIFILQTSCMHSSVNNVPTPIVVTHVLENCPTYCNFDALDDYSAGQDPVVSTESITKVSDDTSGETETEACVKLREAIMLSMPDDKNQNDKIALELLKELIQDSTLSSRDIFFSNQLFLQVQQRLELRKLISAQKKHRLKIEVENKTLKGQLDTLQSQLNQLKNIEVEIEKKERSVISPISDNQQ